MLAMFQTLSTLSKPHSNPAVPVRKVGSEILGHSLQVTQLVNSKARTQTQTQQLPTRLLPRHPAEKGELTGILVKIKALTI